MQQGIRALRQGAVMGLVSVAVWTSSMVPGLAQTATLIARNASSSINVRSRPSAEAFSPGYGLSGDRVEIQGEAPGDDGYIWYFVQFQASRAQGWVRGDLVRLSDPTPRLSPDLMQSEPPQRPSLSASTRESASESAPNTTAVSAPLPARRALQNPIRRSLSPLRRANESERQARLNPLTPATVSPEAIAYFLEVAMGTEFGGNEAKIRKWAGNIRIKVNGLPTDEDLKTLQAVMRDINGLTHGVQLQLDDRNPNLEIYFVPESEFQRYEPNYRPRNYGFFWTRWNNDTIASAKVLISSSGVNQQERSHLIREELTQSLGLMQDSYRHSDSIFFQGWTDTNAYSDLDRALIQMLYQTNIQPGMTRSQVQTVLRSPRSGLINQASAQ